MGQYMASNEPVNGQKSNTAIMASSIGWGLAGSAATEAGSYGFMKAQIKYADKIADFSTKSGTPMTKESVIEDAKMGVYGSSEDVSKIYRKMRMPGADKVDKFAKTKAGKLFMGGSSTKAGRISNYGIGLATSVIGGMLTINKNKE